MLALQDYLAQVEARKLEIGMRETDADVDAMRNQGANRTEAKRQLLASVDGRAHETGSRKVVSYY